MRERQIVPSTREQFPQFEEKNPQKESQPLLFAGMILEGGTPLDMTLMSKTEVMVQDIPVLEQQTQYLEEIVLL